MATDLGVAELKVKVTTEIDKLEGTLIKDEPVLAGHAALWIVSMLGEFLVGHTHLVTAHEWTALESTLVPFATTVLLGVFAWAIRSVVTPAGRAITAAVEKVTPTTVVNQVFTTPVVHDVPAATVDPKG